MNNQFYLKPTKGTPSKRKFLDPKYVGVVINEELHYYTILILGGRNKRGVALNEEIALNETSQRSRR